SDPEHLAAPELEPVPEPTPEPEHSPASAETEWAVPQHNAPPELPEEPPTRNVPLMNHAALFAEAQAAQEAQDAQEFNPEATRVATIPQELLQAATQAGYDPYPSVYQPAQFAPPPVQAASENQEEGHFQDVYREFLQTREACGEGGDGLTYEKFAVKLRKNRDQLVAKYHCRTVRFQVYVKEGKAALKATPIKD
ncbi:MAG: MXAN_5187 family protein, partial [Myxococcaceae bacterium]